MVGLYLPGGVDEVAGGVDEVVDEVASIFVVLVVLVEQPSSLQLR